MLNNIDCVPSNVQSSHQEALYVFEDNEAVIKIIISGRSPTMRHVSRTHRVALDWLFDRINLDPNIQIKFVDTENQLTNMLTKGSFTRDEWDHLLRLVNIVNFSMFSCSQFLTDRKQCAMSKIVQESTRRREEDKTRRREKREERREKRQDMKEKMKDKMREDERQDERR